MFQDIFPHVYHNEYTPEPAGAQDFVLVFSEEGLYCRVQDNALRLPTVESLAVGQESLQFLFRIDETGYYLFEGSPLPAAHGWDYRQTRPLRRLLPDQQMFAMAAAESLWRWYGNNRFCGRCGQPMARKDSERAFCCPRCGNTVYPKICPGVIVAVHDGSRLVLTKYRDRPITHYALIAGFNEIGESIEDTVRREVREEVGLEVEDLRFYKSQPWVFTDSLLMGFTARLKGSDRITMQEDELSVAQWFDRDDLPDNHSDISLTGEMIEQFRLNKL